MKAINSNVPISYTWPKRIYILTLIVLAFTGFGQMPIFKRYYITSIPGLGWSANYFATHYVHYVAASVLIALIVYTIFHFYIAGKKYYRLHPVAYLPLSIMAGIVVTGIFRVLKNLPNVVFSPGFTMFIDLTHLGLVLLYLFTALALLIAGKKWLIPRA